MVEKYRLHSMPAAQCHIEIDEDTRMMVVNLVSYATWVLSVRLDKETSDFGVWTSGTYSVTTARHINRFTTEFLGTNHYFSVKSASAYGFPMKPVELPNDSTSYVQHFLNQIQRYREGSFAFGHVKRFNGRH